MAEPCIWCTKTVCGHGPAIKDMRDKVQSLTAALAKAEQERDAAKSEAESNDASYCIMRDEVERIRPRLRAAERERDEAHHRLNAAVASCAAMREAVQRVQWRRHIGNDGRFQQIRYCPDCGNSEGEGHNETDCGIGAALAPTAGTELLARLKAAEAVCGAIDGRHPIAAGDRVGVLLKAWRESK